MAYQFPSRPRPSKRWRYVAVIPDMHVGYIAGVPTYSIPAWDIAVQALQHDAKRLTDVVFLGDFGSWESMSHWAALRAEQCFVEEDVALVNARLDEVERITRRRGIEVWFCEGNHEAWATQFEAKYPAMRDAVNLRHRLRFAQRGWHWVPENHFLQIGDSHYTHGHIRGVRMPADMVRRKGVSVLYGHTHQYITQSVRMLSAEHAAWTMGCLCSIDPPPPYCKGEQPDTWVQGFGRVQVRSNGLFQVSFRRIMDETWTELEDGTELRADTRACRARYSEDQHIRKELRKKYADRFYHPDGTVIQGGELPEPHHGKVSTKGEVSAVARARRARIVRTLPDVARGGNL